MDKAILKKWLAVIFCLGLIFYFSGLTGPRTDLRPIISQYPELVEKVKSLPHIQYKYAGRYLMDNRDDPVLFIYLVMRKAGHVIFYGLFSFFLANALGAMGMKGFRRWFLAAVVVLAVAMIDELNQSRVAGRSSLIQDVGMDMTGFLIAAFFIKLLKKRC